MTAERRNDDGVDFDTAVRAVISGTEPGEVMAYGEVAAEAGFPGAARAVGTLLSRSTGLPWWRIVNAAGRLIPHNVEEQTRRLRAEGVNVVNGRVRPG